MFLLLYQSGVYFLRLTAVFIFRPGTEDPEAEKTFFPLVLLKEISSSEFRTV